MKILIADDHALFREALSQVVQELDPEILILEAHNWHAAHDVCKRHPDLALALVDLGMHAMNAHAELNSFIRSAQTIPVVVLSASENLYEMQYAFSRGAVGFIAKSEMTPVLLSAIRLVLSGGVYVPRIFIRHPPHSHQAPDGARCFGLTPRQLEVLKALMQGKSNKEIASQLNLSIVTIKIHMGAIFKALNVRGRMQAIQRAQNLGINQVASTSCYNRGIINSGVVTEL